MTSLGPKRETSRRRRSRCAVLRGCSIAAVALLFVIGTLRANSTYFYCAMMGETALDPCCGHHGHRSVHAGYRAPDCCQGRNVGSLPAAHIVVSQEVAPAPLAFVLLGQSYPPAPRVRAANLHWLRWGSDPPQPTERRSQLMVFLT